MPRRIRGSGDVSLLEVVTSYSELSATSFLVATACVVAIADVGCAITLYGEVHHWAPGAWWPLAILKNTWDKQSFSNDSADILLLVIARLSILPIIALLAATKGKPPETAPVKNGASNGRNGGSKQRSLWRRILCCCSPRFRHDETDILDGNNGRGRGLLDLNTLEGGGSSRGDESFYVPLLSTHREGAGDRDTASPSPPLRGEDTANQFKDAISEKDVEAAKDAADRRKSYFLVLLFGVSTVMQVYTGVKCVMFKFTNEPTEDILMGLGVLWLNAIVWCLTSLVADATMEKGFLEPALHPHRLYPAEMAGHRCDGCRQRIKTEHSKGWRCKLCDFDLCRLCYEKKDRMGMEGALRGDKGVRVEEDLQTMGYFKRALGLVRPHWPLFSLGFACLAVSNTANIALPNFQGGILDRVVRADVAGFKRYIVLYIILSAIIGAIGSCQRLCFRLAGFKMAIGARNKLYKGVVSQDLAFFDGTTSGKLTSRLSSDVNAMVSPCTYMLGTLFSNIMRLAGGVVMCFVTSWRLSMLAFTTVGPIYHITQVYAKWSQRLNVEIYVAYGEANGNATEALGNIRTVKAMSTELQEMAKYNAATEVALEKGIKDSFGSALTNAMSSYLDQGAGALILWYGGSLAMDGEDRMTAGRLITYQLYWNMINNAWQSLLGVITSLTRAAGAAQRVFSLMDSLPDIDINSGIVIDETSFRGEISIQAVEFTYQMRPDNKVLKGVDLHIPGGTTCALVGRSGSGKTTLVHLLLRFYDPKAGRILVDGVPLPDLHLRSLHRKTAIVAQDTQLFATSIYGNITYGLEEGEFTEADVHEAAKQACAHDFISEFAGDLSPEVVGFFDAVGFFHNCLSFACLSEDGYQTLVGERGTRLSGGQKQRVAIARALLRKPRLLLLDEATSALDAESEASVQQALDALVEKGAGSTTVILVAHRLSTVMNAQNIAVMDKGLCIEQGTHDSLMTEGGVYSSLVARQISRAANTLQQEASAGETSGSADIDTLMDELERKKNANSGAQNTSGSHSRNGVGDRKGKPSRDGEGARHRRRGGRG